MNEMSHQGVAAYYFLFEMCAEKLEKLPDRDLEEVDCLFRFSPRVVRQTCRISQTNLGRLLDICQTNGLLSFRFFQEELEIKMPILLDLLDYDSKKSRPRRATIAPESRLEKSRVEKNKNKEATAPVVGDSEYEILSEQFKTAVSRNRPGTVINGPDAKRRFFSQIKTLDDCRLLDLAIVSYERMLQENSTRLPKSSFETFLGTPRSTLFWRGYIEDELKLEPQPHLNARDEGLAPC